MRRIRLLVEGYETSDGRYIVPGAIRWRDPLPVMGYVGHESRLLGEVTGLRRDGHSITGETDVDGALTADVSEGDFEDSAELLTIRAGLLVGMTRTGRDDAWPWPGVPQEGEWDD